MDAYGLILYIQLPGICILELYGGNFFLATVGKRNWNTMVVSLFAQINFVQISVKRLAFNKISWGELSY